MLGKPGWGPRPALIVGFGPIAVRFTNNDQVWMIGAMGAMLSYSKACFGVPKHGTLFLF